MTSRFDYVIDEILTDKFSTKYLLFPIHSRVAMKGADVGRTSNLRDTVNQLMRDDLDLDRIWRGFGTHEGHFDFRGSQLVVGRGSNSSAKSIGSSWHCEAGNNWFVQVEGMKRWYFLDQKFSAYMQPRREGLSTMSASAEMIELEKYLPRTYVDVRAGDMVYTPDWTWHTIKNYAGISIGAPIREFNVTLSARNNMHYSLIALINNKLDQLFGIHYGFKHSG
mmetsp:Transcript_19760/g.20039  ORF Transcript_19760/g.20039 Transcript_19760/m.20039 type:complete len:222 (-) Transcript_19760:99-764(-)